LEYLYFALAIAAIVVIVCIFIYSEPAREVNRPRIRPKTKSHGTREQLTVTKPEERQTSLNGGRYVPSYQSNPDAVKHIERFLRGFAAAVKPNTAEKCSADADEQKYPAGKRAEKESIKTEDPAQLELGIENNGDDFRTVNE